MSSDDHQLDGLLKKTGSLLPDELGYLISAFIPSNKSSSKAYLILSAFAEGVRKGKSPEDGTNALESIFSPLVIPHLEETNEHDILIATSFITALFQVDWQSAAAIFQKDGVLELIMDSADLKPSPELALQVAQLLSQACGHKPCRAILPPETAKWLELVSGSSNPESLRAAATVALVKLSKGSASDAAEMTGGSADSAPAVSINKSEDELARAMKSLMLSADGASDAVEGLAYLSVNPAVKETICQDTAFLKALFGLVPRRRKSTTTVETSSSLLYGILVIISNICAYLPQLTEEQSQMQKLRQMAKATGAAPADEATTALNSDDKVRARCKTMVANGVLDVFSSALAASDSPGIRLEIGKSLLAIISDKDNRGKVLSSGCAKVLHRIIKPSVSTPPSSSKKAQPVLDAAYLEPIQALAKLTITAAPIQVYGPDVGAIYDAIRPFSLALQHSSSLLLQRFEIMMALTNLASHSPEVATRIAEADGLLNRVELLLLEDHVLIRRAAMELICNLIVGSEGIFEKYGGGDEDAGVKNKIQVVLALSDVDDLPTRLAASGALATLSGAPAACRALQSLQLERHRALPIIGQLIDPSADPESEDPPQEADTGLMHRGVICARNVLLSTAEKDRESIVKDVKSSGLLQALSGVVKNVKEPQIVQPAVEALKWVLQQ